MSEASPTVANRHFNELNQLSSEGPLFHNDKCK